MTDKLTVDGEFTRLGSLEPHSIAFHSNARPVLTIRPSGKIELGEDADPTEAAAQCIEAMGAGITGMISNAVNAEREAIVKWLRLAEVQMLGIEFESASRAAAAIEDKEYLK